MFGARRWNLKPDFNHTVGYKRKFPYIHSLEGVGDFSMTPASGVVECVKNLTKVQGFDEFAKSSLSNLTNKHFWTQKIKEGVDKSKSVAGLEDIFDKKFYNKKFKKAFCCNVDDKGLNQLAMAFCKALCENISKAFEDRSAEYGGKETEKKVDYLLAKKLKEQAQENYTLNEEAVNEIQPAQTEAVGNFKPYKQLFGVGNFSDPNTQQYGLIARKEMLENQAIRDFQEKNAKQRVIDQITPEMGMNARLANQGMLVELNDLQNDIITYKNEIQNYKKQIETLQSQLDAASNQISSQEKVMSENSSLKQALNQVQQQLNQVQQQLQQASQNNSQLQSQLNAQQNDLSNMDRLKSSNVELATQLNQCKNNNIELNEQISHLQTSIKDFKDQLETKGKDSILISQLQSTVDQLQITISSLKSECQNKDSIIGQYKEAVQKLQAALQEAQSKASSGGGGGGFLGGIGNVVGDVLGTITKPIGGILKMFGVGNFCLPGAQDWEVFLHKIIVDGDQVNKEKFIKILDDKIKNVKKVEIRQKINGVSQELTEEEKDLEEILNKNALPLNVEEQIEKEALKELETEIGQPLVDSNNDESLLGKKRAADSPLINFAELTNNYSRELKEKIEIALKGIEEGLTGKLSVPENDIKTKASNLKDISNYCFESLKFVKGLSTLAPKLGSEFVPLTREIELLLGEIIRQVNLLIEEYQVDITDSTTMGELVDIVGKRLENILLNYFSI